MFSLSNIWFCIIKRPSFRLPWFNTKRKLKSTGEQVKSALAHCRCKEGLPLQGEKSRNKKMRGKRTVFKKHRGYLSFLFFLGPKGLCCFSFLFFYLYSFYSSCISILLFFFFMFFSHVSSWPEMRTGRPSYPLKVRQSYVYRRICLKILLTFWNRLLQGSPVLLH